jgi:hypothetical protein
MRFRIVFVRRPSSSCGLSYIPTKTNNAEQATSRAHMWAHMIWAHFRAWEVGPRPYAGRIRPPFRLQSCLYWPGDGRGLARSQARNAIKKYIYAKLPKWQLIPLSCHNGNLAHIPTVPSLQIEVLAVPSQLSPMQQAWWRLVGCSFVRICALSKRKAERSKETNGQVASDPPFRRVNLFRRRIWCGCSG